MELAPFIIELFENSDAEVIEFSDPPLKITRKYYFKELDGTTPFQNPNIQIINTINNNIQIDNKAIINNIIKGLKDEGRGHGELQDVRNKLDELNKEVQKKKPKWDKIKKIIIWALEYSKDFFVQLLPLLLKINPQ